MMDACWWLRGAVRSTSKPHDFSNGYFHSDLIGDEGGKAKEVVAIIWSFFVKYKNQMLNPLFHEILVNDAFQPCACYWRIKDVTFCNSCHCSVANQVAVCASCENAQQIVAFFVSSACRSPVWIICTSSKKTLWTAETGPSILRFTMRLFLTESLSVRGAATRWVWESNMVIRCLECGSV